MFHMLEELARISDHCLRIFLSGTENAARGRQVWQASRVQNVDVGAIQAILFIIHICLMPESFSLRGTQVQWYHGIRP
jgi:hypothetical protein